MIAPHIYPELEAFITTWRKQLGPPTHNFLFSQVHLLSSLDMTPSSCNGCFKNFLSQTLSPVHPPHTFFYRNGRLIPNSFYYQCKCRILHVTKAPDPIRRSASLALGSGS